MTNCLLAPYHCNTCTSWEGGWHHFDDLLRQFVHSVLTSAALLLPFLMVFLATTCPLQISSGGRSTMLGSPTLFFSSPCVRGRRAGENGISGLASTDLIISIGGQCNQSKGGGED